MTLNKLTLEDKYYKVIDVREVSISDSFVKTNKLFETEGHGEARLYVGSAKNGWDVFFNGFYNAMGVFCKSHLLKYLDDVKFEYQAQSQKYRKDISSFWMENVDILSKLQELEYFRIEEANGIKDKARFYIRSQDEIYDIFRKIILPIITNLSIVKLEDEKRNTIFLFRPFLEYDENSQNQINLTNEEEEIKKREDISEKEKYTIIKARNGQGKWRESLIDELSCCIITKVNDERLLIASHIKPWTSSTDKEKIDKNNGLLLTPTFDKLFDRGFITFLPNSSVLISPYLSPYNISKLKIPSKCDLIFNPKRLNYLEYHLKNIFKKG